MGIRSKALHLVSDLTTVILNPISDDEPSKTHDTEEINVSEEESIAEQNSGDTTDGPDTSSFTAFLYSLLSSSETESHSNVENQNGINKESNDAVSEPGTKEMSKRKSLFTRGRQSLGKVIYHAVRSNGYKNKSSENNDDCNVKHHDGNDSGLVGIELRPVQTPVETVSQYSLPEISEPSLLLSEKARRSLYASLPAIVQGKKWVLLYSTWRNGISLSTLYRRSMLCPGFSLLVVGDRQGAVFGGLVETPLRPTNQRKYQGTNNTFVFTNTSGSPVVFCSTGANRYFTVCSTDFLALGGGGHFALYLDGDLLSGSSSVSETFANPCLAHSEDFEVKEVELWGFTYASKYEETITFCRTEAPGLCRW